MIKARFLISRWLYEDNTKSALSDKSEWIDLTLDQWNILKDQTKCWKILGLIKGILVKDGKMGLHDEISFVVDPVSSFVDFNETLESAFEEFSKAEEKLEIKKKKNLEKSKKSKEEKEKKRFEELKKKYEGEML